MRVSRLLAFFLLAAAPGHPAAPLKIVNAGVHEIEDGPPLAIGSSFVPGETLYFNFLVENYHATPEGKVRLSYKLDTLDPRGTKIIETVESSVDTTLSPQDKDWKPKVRQAISLPSLAPSGEYRIAVELKDDLSLQTASLQVPFKVNGHDVPPSPDLTVRNFAFYRGEDDPSPLKLAAFRPGDRLWARFDIAGYKLGDRNTVDVTYGVTVLNAVGKVLYSQPDAATEKSFSFYPKPFVPGTMNLSLQPNMRAGEYTILLTVRDNIGNQSYETKQTFRVE